MSDDSIDLRISIPGCTVTVRAASATAIEGDLRAALAELADAVHAEVAAAAEADDEVTGFALSVGSLGLESAKITASKNEESCWWYDDGGHCGWYSGPKTGEGGASSCTIHTWK